MKMGVVGAGAWGTALAQVMAQRWRRAAWALEEDVVASINTHHVNDHYPPTIQLSPMIRATGDLADMAECDVAHRYATQHVHALLWARCRIPLRH